MQGQKERKETKEKKLERRNKSHREKKFLLHEEDYFFLKKITYKESHVYILKIIVVQNDNLRYVKVESCVKKYGKSNTKLSIIISIINYQISNFHIQRPKKNKT